MFTIKFSATELENLKIFLNRINLQGKEVNAFIAVINKLNTAKKDEVKVEEKITANK